MLRADCCMYDSNCGADHWIWWLATNLPFATRALAYRTGNDGGVYWNLYCILSQVAIPWFCLVILTVAWIYLHHLLALPLLNGKDLCIGEQSIQTWGVS